MKGDLDKPLSNFPNIAAILKWFTLGEWFGFKIPFVCVFCLMCSFSRKKITDNDDTKICDHPFLVLLKQQ